MTLRTQRRMCPGEGDTGRKYSEGERQGTLGVLVRGKGTLMGGSERDLSLCNVYNPCMEEFWPLNMKCIEVQLLPSMQASGETGEWRMEPGEGGRVTKQMTHWPMQGPSEQRSEMGTGSGFTGS